MQNGNTLQFKCSECKNPIPFSLFELSKSPTINCVNCQQEYQFDDPVLIKQVRQFEKLCSQLIESEEILSETSIGITLGDKEITIPFKLLLTRFTPRLDLQVGSDSIPIECRIEPTKDYSISNNLELKGVNQA